MSTAKKLIRSPRIIVLLVFLLISIVAIHPSFEEGGVAIRSVVQNSSANLASPTMDSPKPNAPPMSREVIKSINNVPINSVKDYHAQVSKFTTDISFTITTNKGVYRLTTKPLTKTTVLNETETITVEESYLINETINGTLQEVEKKRNITKTVPKTETEIIGVQDIGLSVYEAPKNNIRKGLDLQGGTRVLLRPEEKVSDDTMGMLIDSMKQRLNVFGLSDIVVRKSSDLSGNQFVVVEIAGINEEEVKDLLAKQGKFEAKIGNETVFIGGKDITYVCRSADCSGIDPNTGCSPIEGGFACRFRFSIALTPESAKRQADITKDIPVITHAPDGKPYKKDDQYLEEKLDLYLDDALVDTLNIGADLKGKPVTDISISGSGFGSAEQEAVLNALSNMKELQTILVTGSLPVKLNIVKTDTITPSLGKEFVRNALLVGVLTILAVAVVIFIRYRKLKVAIPVVITMASEILLLLGLASLIGWNIDLAAIAGIIIAVGTGVDHQIIIADETLRGHTSYTHDWKRKIKNAFFIIMVAYVTTLVAMIPLLFAGAGLLKGFALTTMMGVSFGVFITRPAFAAMIEILLKE